jgi:hypothetical protein
MVPKSGLFQIIGFLKQIMGKIFCLFGSAVHLS